MSLALRLVAHTPNGPSLGVLPTPNGFAASYLLGDVGALSLDYAQAAPRSELLGRPVEIALETSTDGRTFTEPADSRFLYLRDATDPQNRAGTIRAECPNYLWRLRKAYVGTQDLRVTDGKRHFLSATAGQIVGVMAAEAQARGALEGMTFGSFSNLRDSSGQPWSRIITLAYEPTVTLLQVVLNLVQQGVLDVSIRGRDVRLHNPDTVQAVDTTLQPVPVVLRRGQDLVEAPAARSWEGLASDVLLLGEDGLSSTRSNPSAIRPWGRWEATITQGGVSDPGTMAILSDAELARGADVRRELTNGLTFATTPHLPFRDYSPGDYVWLQGLTGRERLRVRSITLGQDISRTVTGNVVLNDRFLEQEIRDARRVEGITGGATNGGGTGARPAEVARANPQAPRVPQDVVLTSLAYQDAEGRTFAFVTLTWDAVSQNADLTPADDVNGYDAQYRLSPGAPWSPAYTGADTTVTLSGLPVGVAIYGRVRARNSSGRSSSYSDAVSVITEADATPPPAPSTPVVTSYLGQVLARWDGLTSTGTDMPPDLSYIEVHVGNVAGFDTTPATRYDALDAPGVAVITGGFYGTPVHVRLVAYDRVGNASLSSASASAEPQRVSGLDVAALAIETANLGDFAVTSAKIADLSVISAKIGNLAVDDAKIGSLSAGKITAGLLQADVTVSARIKTGDTGARVELTPLGLYAYNATNAVTVSIPTTGSPTFTGTVRGSVIEGSLIRASSLQTGTPTSDGIAVGTISGTTVVGVPVVNYETDRISFTRSDGRASAQLGRRVGLLGGPGAFIVRGYGLAGAGENAEPPEISLSGDDNTGDTRISLRSDSVALSALIQATTSNSPSVYSDNFGNLRRSTSSLRYKTDVTSLGTDDALRRLARLRAVSFRDRKDPGGRWYIGLIAEEVHDAGLTELVEYVDLGDGNGLVPDAVMYDRLAVLMLPYLADLTAKMDTSTPHPTTGAT